MYNRNNPASAYKLNTAHANLDYNRKKVARYFDEDLLHQVLYGESPNMERYWGQLQATIKKLSCGASIRDALILNLPDIVCEERPTKEEFCAFRKALAFYRKCIQKDIEQEITEDYGNVIGYYHYLSRLTNRTEREANDWKLFHEFLYEKGKL